MALFFNFSYWELFINCTVKDEKLKAEGVLLNNSMSHEASDSD
jgi:hypothetical protein